MTTEADAAETFARLLGLRVTAKLHPDVRWTVLRRVNTIMTDLDRVQLLDLVWAAVNASSDIYITANATSAHREAENIARTLRDAEDAGVA
jgi:hypothetical protein